MTTTKDGGTVNLPWTLVQNSWQHTTIYDASGRPVCTFDLEDWDVTEDTQDVLEAEQYALATFIVDAANAMLKAREGE